MSFNLNKISTKAPKELDKQSTKEKTTSILEKVNELQNLLYAESRHSLLIILQGMDASGKDGVICNVFGSLNPQGVTVKSFKVPTAEELSHDFLWRIHNHAPAKGMIQIFNRSQYEDILVTRVHNWIDYDTAKKRMKAINHFESLLQEHNNTHILKFYLHISPETQHERLEERIKNPAKQWKYNENDFKESKLWDEYRKMYEACFEHCNNVPWTIVPSDQNWYKEHVIAQQVHDTLKKLNMQFPGLKNEQPFTSNATRYAPLLTFTLTRTNQSPLQTASYQIKLPQFEGPFDLLLFFIERDELDIYNIPITKIINDFLDFIHAGKILNIELSSEFILFVSTLMRIKAKLLLPRKETDTEGNEIDPRQELIDKILEYRKYKEAAVSMAEMEAVRMLSVKRGNVQKDLYAIGEEAGEGTEIQAITLFKLMKAFEKAMQKLHDRNNRPVHTVVQYNYTMEQSRQQLYAMAKSARTCSFEKLFEGCTNRLHAIFIFLSMLELVQMKYLSIITGDGRNDFIIECHPEQENDLLMELAS